MQDALTAFWRDHGKQWAQEEANPADLERMAGLARKVAHLGQGERQAVIVAELQGIWTKGFANPADAFGWDEMNDQLPASALVAFIEGAREKWEETSPNQ
jgi:hypothetical protein